MSEGGQCATQACRLQRITTRQLRSAAAMRAGSTTRFVGIVVGGGSPSPQPQFSDKIACNMQKTLARAPRFGHGPSQDAARCRSRQARGTSLTNRGLQPWTAYGGNDDRTCRSCGTHRDGKAFQCSLEDFFADAVPDLDQLHRPRLAVGRDAADRARSSIWTRRCRDCS